MLRLKTTLFLVLALCLFAPTARAQSIPGVSEPLIVSTIPDTPRSNETVNVSIQSYSLDLDRALIIWKVEGKEVSRGVGLKQINVNAGPAGSVKQVNVTATLPNLGTFANMVVIKPADVDLVWESDGYTPPFYKGKPLHTFGGSFKVIALPEFIGSNGKKIDSQDLIYTWRKNGEVQASASGYGKNTFTTSQTSYLRDGETISVDVSAPQDNIVGHGDISVAPTTPFIVFYEKSPLYGTIYEKALGSYFTLKNEELTVEAEPYFFSVTNKGSSLSYAWKLNNQGVTAFQDQPLITLRRTGGSGVAAVSLTVQNANRLLQGASKNLNISYE